MMSLPTSVVRGAVLLDPAEMPRCLDDAKELAELLKPDWPEQSLQAMREGPVAGRQPFRTITTDPGISNQTATSTNTDTILWDPAGLAPNTAIPANSIFGGQVFKVTAWGVTTTAVTASQTVIFTPRFGTTTSGTALGVSRTAPVNAAVKTNVPWFMQMWVHFRTTGTAGVATCAGTVDAETVIGTAATTNSATVVFGTGTATASLNTTVASGLLVSVTPSLATQTWQTGTVVMETLN